MAVTSLKITPERSQEIDFSVPFLETGITIIVPVRDGVISPTAFLGQSLHLAAADCPLASNMLTCIRIRM